MDATLKQAGKVLELITQSGRSAEWLQRHLIGSGAFSDLLAVDDLLTPDRDARRRFLGAPPLNPPLLEEIGTVTNRAMSQSFVVRDKFMRTIRRGAEVKISFLGSNFDTWFLGKTEGPMGETELRYSKLTRSSDDAPILKELGDKAVTTLGQIYVIMERQNNGQKGTLLTNGWANIFYVRDINGTLRAVLVYWGGDGWHVSACSVETPGRWGGGSRVFSSNS